MAHPIIPDLPSATAFRPQLTRVGKMSLFLCKISTDKHVLTSGYSSQQLIKKFSVTTRWVSILVANQNFCVL